LAQLKRQLLLVDRIAVIEGSDKDWSVRSNHPALATDLDWLEERGIVFKTDYAGEELERIMHEAVSDSAQRPGTKRASGANRYRLGDPRSLERLREQTRRFEDTVYDVNCRMESTALRLLMDLDAVSLYEPIYKRSANRLGKVEMKQGDIQRLVIENLPEPDETTPLDRVLEFRADQNSKGNIVSLRRWLSNFAKNITSPMEAQQELEWLLAEYERHMQLHEMKTNRGVLETVVTASAETLEDLAKFRWGKLAKSIFAASRRKIDLFEAELKAPGREIALVFHARRTFSTQ
jgi:hypothetical protein